MLTRLTGKCEGKGMGSVTTLTCQVSHSTDLGQSVSKDLQNQTRLTFRVWPDQSFSRRNDLCLYYQACLDQGGETASSF